MSDNIKPFVPVSPRRVVIDTSGDEELRNIETADQLVKEHGKRLGIIGGRFLFEGIEYEHNANTNRCNIVAREKGDKRYVPGKFWTEVIDRATGMDKAKISYRKFILFLQKNGFGRRIIPEGLGYDYIQLVDSGRVIRGLGRNTDQIQDFVNAYLEQEGNELAQEMMMAAADTHYREAKLRSLPPIDINPIQDSLSTCWMFYRNTAIKIRAQKVTSVPYDELPGQIWEHQKLDREYVAMDRTQIAQSDWASFIACAVAETRETATMLAAFTKTPQELREAGNTAALRILATMSAFGYLLHGYKDPALAKAVMAVDRANASDADEANGGSGKSISGKALGHLIARVEMPGRSLRIDKSFLLARVNPETALMHMPDLHKKFDFGDIFNWITEDMEVEKKGKDPFMIPFAMSPKWLCDTNYVPAAEGSAFRRRMHILEFSEYFNDQHTPIKEFKRRFFEQWETGDWHAFDAFYQLCVQRFLTFGLVDFPTENWGTRQVQRQVPRDVLEFFDDWISLDTEYLISDQNIATSALDERAKPAAIKNELENAFRGELTNLSSRIVGKWVRLWARFRGYQINGVAATTRQESIPRVKIRLGGRQLYTYTFTNPTSHNGTEHAAHKPSGA